jgi:hypothetical protein
VRSSLVSLVVHVVIGALLACIVWDQSLRFADDQVLGVLSGEETLQTPLEAAGPVAVVEDPSPKLDPADVQHLLIELEPVAEPVAPTPTSEPSEPKPHNEKGTANSSTPPNGSRSGTAQGPKVTAGRTGAIKGELLKRFGGTGETESAVELGLKWLAQQQAKDGSWSFHGPYPDAAAFLQDNRVAATSMALLAFLGAGHTHKSGDYQAEVGSGLRWMVSRQKRAGAMGAGTPPHHTFYTHAQATLVLSEAYALTEDEWLKPYCQSAIDYAVKSQGMMGGWRYDYQGDSDLSVTGWMMMALVSGRSAGLDVPEKTFERIRGFLNDVAGDAGEVYSSMPGRPATPSMTAEGLLCRMYLGWPRGTSSLDYGAQRLLQVAPFRIDELEFYYWYYATQVMHHLGGEAWERWNEAMKVQLPAAQVKLGPQAGSWSPGGRMFDRLPGRLYATCMSIYCLEVYYRHLPIYDAPFGKIQAQR